MSAYTTAFHVFFQKLVRKMSDFDLFASTTGIIKAFAPRKFTPKIRARQRQRCFLEDCELSSSRRSGWQLRERRQFLKIL